jgi:hypothetical protein
MQFNALIDEVRELSLEEKVEMRSLLDRYVAEDERRRIAESHRESLQELREGRLEFTGDVERLRDMLEG